MVNLNCYLKDNELHGTFMDFVYWIEPLISRSGRGFIGNSLGVSFALHITKGSGNKEKVFTYDTMEEAVKFVNELAEQIKGEREFEEAFAKLVMKC